ncbi:MAG: glycerophosphodiester phosphodiesterase family protein, partial [Muribaculum sp.]|nr:glycerophosphodiester phosphodiesterase family protein [Muribaculum sp.]
MKSIITSFVLCILSIGSHAADRVDSLIHRLHSPADGSVMVAAHRGDWRYAPENSIAAIEHCIEAGADIVELDLRMTKDSVLIVMHDATLDRTTTGKGYVADWTADSIRLLHLKNGCGIKTIHKVPTLEEAMIAAKGKILVNLDKANTYFNLVLPILRNTGTARQVIMKSGRPAHEILSDFGEGYKEVIYMPKINFEKPDAMQSLDEAIEVLGAPAHELKYATSATLPKAMEGTKRLAGKSRIWYNTLWDTQCGGHDDEAALKDCNAAYGFLIDSLKADIIQTDRLQLLLDYLKKRKLNAMPTDTI